VAGDASGRTVTLPLVQAGGVPAYDCTVDWGDGTPTSTITAYNDPNRIHEYAADGTYDVEIRGTCEGWSFNGGGDVLKIVSVVRWGTSPLFGGFKFLSGGFYGCANLISIAAEPISASGTGVGAQGFADTFSGCSFTSVSSDLFSQHVNLTTNAFARTFNGCGQLAGIPAGLFDHATLASDYAFQNTFSHCGQVAAIPAHLFDRCTEVGAYGFASTFSFCSSIAEIPPGLFDSCTKVSTFGFNSAFYGCSSLEAIPTDLFRHNTLVSDYGFQQTFRQCASLVAIPADLFRYNTLVGVDAFRSCFYGCSSLTDVPADLFRYNTAAALTAFRSTFNGCSSLATVPADLFRYNTSATYFQYTFLDCVNLQVNRNIFYADGEQGARFLNQSVDFTDCFDRQAFTGNQGEAPDLWSCDFGTGTPVTTACFGDAGNSPASLSNYADIPADWK